MKTPLPQVSFDKATNKPLFVNGEAVAQCLGIMNGRTPRMDFSADKEFIKYMEETTSKKNPTQKEINAFVLGLVRECSKYKPSHEELSNFYLDGNKVRRCDGDS
jgi:hypothetical protein